MRVHKKDMYVYTNFDAERTLEISVFWEELSKTVQKSSFDFFFKKQHLWLEYNI